MNRPHPKRMRDGGRGQAECFGLRLGLVAY